MVWLSTCPFRLICVCVYVCVQVHIKVSGVSKCVCVGLGVLRLCSVSTTSSALKRGAVRWQDDRPGTIRCNLWGALSWEEWWVIKQKTLRDRARMGDRQQAIGCVSPLTGPFLFCCAAPARGVHVRGVFTNPVTRYDHMSICPSARLHEEQQGKDVVTWAHFALFFFSI